jgi:adenosylmethionine-8-amino-7-oxononanoate aminotransferase
MQGKGQKHKIIAREVAYHGTSMGCLMATGITGLRAPFEPFAQGGCHVPNTNEYHWPEGRDQLWAAEKIGERIEFEGPETVAAVILEPLQNAGGCIPPQEGYFQRVREICDENDVLLISDEVICAWGRLGHYFGCERYGYQPDIITTAKALTSAYAPMGAMIASDKIFEPFSEGTASFTHGFTFAGHPVSAAAAMANLDIYEREDLCGNVPPRRVSSEPSSRNCARSRSSAMFAAPGSSTRSSWSRTRTPRRASRARSPSGCSAGSSPASSTSGASSAARMTAATP